MRIAPNHLQLALPLPLDSREEALLRNAYRSVKLRMPFEAAMHVPALAICLRCLGEARQKRGRPPASMTVVAA